MNGTELESHVRVVLQDHDWIVNTLATGLILGLVISYAPQVI
jgi:hypothetical protein